jgi:hypothetical protein
MFGGNDYQFSFAGGPTLTLAQFLSQVNVSTSSVTDFNGNNIELVGTPSTALTLGSTNDTIYATGANDTITAGTGSQFIAATGANDLIVGGTGYDTLVGLGTNDTLVAVSNMDALYGGTGASVDFVINDPTESIQLQSNPGNDTVTSSVTYTLPTGINTLVLTGGSAALKGTANDGNDTLISNSGIDTLMGGKGNDLFIVNNANDTVMVGPTHGNDTIQSSVSFNASLNVATVVLTGNGNLATKGNSLANKLVANSGNDTLTAGSGIATLVGGSGNDTFVINNASDVIQDSSTTAINTIQSTVSYSLLSTSNVNNLVLSGNNPLKGTANNGTDTLTSNTGIDTLVGGTGTDTFIINNTSDVVTVTTTGTNDTVQSSVTYTLPTNVQYLTLTGSSGITGTGNGLTDLIIGNTGKDTLTGGAGIAVLEAGTAGNQLLQATKNQGALMGGGAADTLTGGAFKDFFAAGKVSDVITTGATANVIAFNKGSGALTINPTSGAKNVLSLGAGIDTETLTFTKTGNNLILSDGTTGDSITFTNWYASTANQVVTTLQVVEIASASYSATSTDKLRNQALEEFNFTSIVSQFNTAGSPANWTLKTGMPTAQLASSATMAYGGDLAYYEGLNGNLTNLNLSAAQSTLTNASFATATQTIDAWSSISGGGLKLMSIVTPASIAAATSPAVLSLSVDAATLSSTSSTAISHRMQITDPVTDTPAATKATIASALQAPVNVQSTLLANVTSAKWAAMHAVIDGPQPHNIGISSNEMEHQQNDPVMRMLMAATRENSSRSLTEWRADHHATME